MFPLGHIFYGLQSRHYKCLIMDPPTRFVGGTNGRPQHYKRMSWEQIASLPLKDLAHPDGCWVFCWIGSPQVRNMFKANEGWTTRKGVVVPGWGAKFSGRAFVWVKLKRKFAKLSPQPEIYHANDWHVGMGYGTRKNAEDCYLFKFGTPKRRSKKVRELIVDPVREHSRKPMMAMDRIIEFAEGPYCELFSRESDPRVEAWGDEAKKFDKALMAA